MPLLFTAGILIALYVPGDWLLHRLLGPTSGDRLERFVLGASTGLALYTLALCNLYFLSGSFTVQSIAWPLLTLFLAPLLALERRPSSPSDGLAWAALIIPTAAVLLFSLPLWGQPGLGFYFLNNGEFSNYAALGDVAQYHPCNTPIHWWFPLNDLREAVVGLLCAQISAVTGHPTLWVILPLSWALAWLGLAALGLLLRQLALRLDAGPLARALVALLLAWAALSASAQFNWTVSWASEYLNLPFLYACLFLLARWQATPQGSFAGRALVIGLLLGAMLCAYPEMFSANVLLLGGFAFLLALASKRWGLLAALAVGLLLALLAANRFGIRGLALRQLGSASKRGLGWNIYGSHSMPLDYFARLLGLCNSFSGPSSPNAVHASLAALLVAASCLWGAWCLWRAREPLLKGVGGLTCAFYAGLAMVFALILHQGTGVNYLAVKWVFQYGGLAILGLAAAVISLRSRPLLLVLALVLAVISRDLIKTGARFATYQAQASQGMRFSEADGQACRQALVPGQGAYVSALPDMDNYKIIGKFLLYDHDLYAANGSFPTNDPQPFKASGPLLVLGDASALSGDPHVHGRYAPFFSRGDLSLLRKAP